MPNPPKVDIKNIEGTATTNILNNTNQAIGWNNSPFNELSQTKSDEYNLQLPTEVVTMYIDKITAIMKPILYFFTNCLNFWISLMIMIPTPSLKWGMGKVWLVLFVGWNNNRIIPMWFP